MSDAGTTGELGGPDAPAAVREQLRHALAAIRADAEAGAQGADSPLERRRFRRIVTEAARLAGLLDALLPAEAEAWATASPAALLAEVLREAGPRCAQAGIEVDAALDRGATARLRPALLRRALRELVNAAIRAMPRGGRLAARVRSGGGGVLIEVGDTGLGLPGGLDEQVFRPGAGLAGEEPGLVTAYRAVVAGHGGRLWYETQAGRGTTFVVELPAAAPDDADGPGADADPVAD